MPFLLIIAFPFIEIYLAIKVADEIGLLNAILMLCGAVLVGFGLLQITGRTFLMELQLRAVRGEQIEKVLLSQAMRFAAGLLFIIPGFITDIMACTAIVASFIPGLFVKPINRNIKNWNSNFVVFKTGQTGPSAEAFRRAQQSYGPGPRDVTPEDPQIIDVSPEKPNSQD